MTQILGLLTHDCVLLAADRLLTWNGGERDGTVYKDEECKLVALCGCGGIGYTGLARLARRPTHEWIAITLAEANTRRIAEAVRVLPVRLAAAVDGVPTHLRGLTLFAAAWDWFGDPAQLRPHFALVTNQYDPTGNLLTSATGTFSVFTRVLQAAEPFALHLVGRPLAKKRADGLSRSIRRAVDHRVGPNSLLEYLVREVQHSSTQENRVGDRILAMSVPRAAVESWQRSGRYSLLASTATRRAATFGYFNPGRNELVQFGPTLVCGGMAVTDLEGTNDPTTDNQSASFRFLRLAKSKDSQGRDAVGPRKGKKVQLRG